ncbi:hypothetical protein E2C01_008029 [Portunus trituberculatus]|uniref:Uncharacterized protein n=1 Tax=Portunus trituberculatus TaxID=210409 RepID=A0A5B7D2U2_PORTR|nr:hypothetical protein [Portunus trituberculatus]
MQGEVVSINTCSASLALYCTSTAGDLVLLSTASDPNKNHTQRARQDSRAGVDARYAACTD